MSTQTDNIWLQPGTRLHMIVYKDDKWQVWVATDSRSGNSDAWHGTYLELHADGRCEQHYRSEVAIQCITLRPGRE